MKVIKTKTYVKTAQIETPAVSPSVAAGGINKNKLKAMIYKRTEGILKGIFRDDGWVPVHAFFRVLRDEMQLDYDLDRAEYGKNSEGVPSNKTWTFHIDFTNQNQKPDTIYGRLVAAGAGGASDPLESYDLVMTLS